MKTTCEQCGCDFDATGRRGRTPRFCSNACRQRAYRARRKLPTMPDAMTSARRWVRAAGKRPITTTGAPAASTAPRTWTTLDEVRDGPGDGYGFMLGGGVGCYDLDGAVEAGKVLPWAREVLDGIPEPVVYTELSVSGRGLHVFVEAPEGRGTRREVPGGSVERYTRARFIRCGVPMIL